jgi:hypothetical protein
VERSGGRVADSTGAVPRQSGEACEMVRPKEAVTPRQFQRPCATITGSHRLGKCTEMTAEHLQSQILQSCYIMLSMDNAENNSISPM